MADRTRHRERKILRSIALMSGCGPDAIAASLLRRVRSPRHTPDIVKASKQHDAGARRWGLTSFGLPLLHTFERRQSGTWYRRSRAWSEHNRKPAIYGRFG